MRLRVAAVAVALFSAVGASLDHLDRGAARPVPPAERPARAAPAVVRPPIAVGVDTRDRVVALTFDDGPDPRWTPAILDALAAVGARATFFVTGDHARAHPDLLRAMAAGGHEIANHTDSHPMIDELAPEAVRHEVREAAGAVRAAGVRPSAHFRPPAGRYDAESLDAVEGSGLAAIGWTVCLERWLRRDGLELGVEETAARVRPGSIVLAHDGGIPDRTMTVEALPLLLAKVAHAGYEMVTVEELLRRGPAVRGLPGTAGPPPILTGAAQQAAPFGSESALPPARPTRRSRPAAMAERSRPAEPWRP